MIQTGLGGAIAETESLTPRGTMYLHFLRMVMAGYGAVFIAHARSYLLVAQESAQRLRNLQFAKLLESSDTLLKTARRAKTCYWQILTLGWN